MIHGIDQHIIPQTFTNPTSLPLHLNLETQNEDVSRVFQEFTVQQYKFIFPIRVFG